MNCAVPAGAALVFTDEYGAPLDTSQRVLLTRTITTTDTTPGQPR